MVCATRNQLKICSNVLFSVPHRNYFDRAWRHVFILFYIILYSICLSPNFEWLDHVAYIYRMNMQALLCLHVLRVFDTDIVIDPYTGSGYIVEMIFMNLETRSINQQQQELSSGEELARAHL